MITQYAFLKSPHFGLYMVGENHVSDHANL